MVSEDGLKVSSRASKAREESAKRTQFHRMDENRPMVLTEFARFGNPVGRVLRSRVFRSREAWEFSGVRDGIR